MPVTIRPAGPEDIGGMVPLMVADARRREGRDAQLWKLADTAGDKVGGAVKQALTKENPPFRQQWLVAEAGGGIVGIAHTILLPVPPIYAGEFGPPGLIMEDCCVSADAPDGTAQALLEAAEADLTGAGAKILLGSAAPGDIWEGTYAAGSYDPLTLYLARSGLRAGGLADDIRPAAQPDLPGIVRASAANRQVLHDLSEFWKPHDEADARFGGWMGKSLALPDRDMFVSVADGAVTGYAISQPATPLHFPPAHDIAATGVIDDYFHPDFADPAALRGDGAAARLFRAAEAALQARGARAALVVCPAAWQSKIDMLQAEGYRTQITWYRKRPA